MKKNYVSLIILIICTLNVSAAVAQQVEHAPGGLKSLAVPNVKHICTLDPTDLNAHFFLEAPRELQQQFKSSATANFEVDYKVTNNSCGASEWPSETLEAFQHAMDIWSVHLNSPVPIKIEAFWTELEDRTLGSAAPTRIVQLPDVGEPDTWYAIAQISAMSGRILREEIDGGLEYDIRINMNCSFGNWYFGTDANPPENTIDLTTVVLHEIGHGIGFFGSISAVEDPQNEGEFLELGEWGTGENTLPFIYDRFATDGEDISLLNEDVYPNPSTRLFEALTGRRGGVFFDGESALATLEESPVTKAKLYTPEEFSQGSSYSHVDQETFTMTPNALMRPRIDRALAIHSPGPLFCGIITDMGWPLGDGCLSFIPSSIILTSIEKGINFGVLNETDFSEMFFSVNNRNDAALPLKGRIELNNPNFGISNQSDFILMPGESLDFEVRYDPTSADRHAGDLIIHHDAKNKISPLILSLDGEALERGQIAKLEQSFPNPTVGSRASLQIPFAISENSTVNLEIYTSDGRLVKTIIDGEIRDAMRHEETVNMNGLASGVYFYRLIVDGEVESGKFMHVQ